MNNGAITFGNEQNNGGSVLGAIKDSAVNVGITALAGGTAGAVGGKIAALTPYKPSEEAMNFQYGDIFIKAAKKDELPDYIKDKGDDITGVVEKCRNLFKANAGLIKEMAETESLYNQIKKTTEEEIKSEEFQTKLKEFFKEKVEKIPEGGYKKEEALRKAEERYDKICENLKRIDEKCGELQDSFIKSAAKDEKICDIAEKGAKHLRKRCFVGAGIAIGITGALILNLLKTYGVIGKKQTTAASQTAEQ